MSCFFSISVFPHPWAGLGLCRFMGFLQALALHTLHTLGQFLSCFCINICYCGYKSEIKLRKKKVFARKKAPLLSTGVTEQCQGGVGEGGANPGSGSAQKERITSKGPTPSLPRNLE